MESLSQPEEALTILKTKYKYCKAFNRLILICNMFGLGFLLNLCPHYEPTVKVLTSKFSPTSQTATGPGVKWNQHFFPTNFCHKIKNKT